MRILSNAARPVDPPEVVLPKVIMGCQRKTTARCESCGQVLIIMKDDLKQLADQFPHFYTKWVTSGCV